MFASRYRFHSRNSIRYIYRNGTAIRGHLISIHFVKNRRKQNRYGVVVSKKVTKTAVGRNRIRRRIYEVLRHEHPLIQEGIDVICVVGSPDVRSLEYDDLKNSVSTRLREAGLYKNVL